MITLDEQIPATLEEAVEFLYSRTPDDQKELARKMDWSEFIGNTHHFLGQNIRNDWHLWFNDPDNSLTNYFTSIHINHGDDRSGMILDSLYRKLTNQPLEIEKQVQRYLKFWKANGFKDGIFPVPPSIEEWQKNLDRKNVKD